MGEDLPFLGSLSSLVDLMVLSVGRSSKVITHRLFPDVSTLEMNLLTYLLTYSMELSPS